MLDKEKNKLKGSEQVCIKLSICIAMCVTPQMQSDGNMLWLKNPVKNTRKASLSSKELIYRKCLGLQIENPLKFEGL